MGREKALEVVGSKSLLQRVLSRLVFLDREIIVVVGRGKSLPAFNNYPRLRIVTDVYPDKGALGGLYTGLTASGSFYNLVVACDMPFLNQALLRYMIRLCPGFDVVVPRVGELIEPLHAIYARSCLDKVKQLLEDGETRLRGLFDRVRVRYVEDSEIDRFDPRHLSFFNVNTEADLKRAQQLVEELGLDKR